MTRAKIHLRSFFRLPSSLPAPSCPVQRQLLLSCGQDGALWVLDPSSAPASEPFKPAASKGYTSFAHARWADSQQIVSVRY